MKGKSWFRFIKLLPLLFYFYPLWLWVMITFFFTIFLHCRDLGNVDFSSKAVSQGKERKPPTAFQNSLTEIIFSSCLWVWLKVNNPLHGNPCGELHWLPGRSSNPSSNHRICSEWKQSLALFTEQYVFDLAWCRPISNLCLLTMFAKNSNKVSLTHIFWWIYREINIIFFVITMQWQSMKATWCVPARLIFAVCKLGGKKCHFEFGICNSHSLTLMKK